MNFVQVIAVNTAKSKALNAYIKWTIVMLNTLKILKILINIAILSYLIVMQTVKKLKTNANIVLIK